jgi:hypothetical protein
MTKLTQERKFDALIATEVMGWVLHLEFRDHKTYVLPDGETCVSEKLIPHFSTDIADAWKVADKLVEDGYTFLYHHNRKDATPASVAGIAALFYRHDAVLQHDWTHADTAPLAICLAARDAIERR